MVNRIMAIVDFTFDGCDAYASVKTALKCLSMMEILARNSVLKIGLGFLTQNFTVTETLRL